MRKLNQDLRTPLRRWMKAQTTSELSREEKQLNVRTEDEYITVLNVAKKLYKQIGDVVAYERNYKICHEDNVFAMHSFITENFYWYLYCDQFYQYCVLYEFNDCPIEDQIRELLVSLPFNHQIERVLLPKLPTTFNLMKASEDPMFFNVIR